MSQNKQLQSLCACSPFAGLAVEAKWRADVRKLVYQSEVFAQKCRTRMREPLAPGLPTDISQCSESFHSTAKDKCVNHP